MKRMREEIGIAIVSIEEREDTFKKEAEKQKENTDKVIGMLNKVDIKMKDVEIMWEKLNRFQIYFQEQQSAENTPRMSARRSNKSEEKTPEQVSLMMNETTARSLNAIKMTLEDHRSEINALKKFNEERDFTEEILA